MTISTTVCVKIPGRILEQIPAPGNGRSGFILQAIEEKLARSSSAPWQPQTARGRRLADLLEHGANERHPLLSEAQVAQELSERRGRNF